MIFNRLLGLFSHDLAIDLGTATTLVYVKGEGIICSEPSAVAVHRDTRGTKKVLAVGIEAKRMIGRTPGNIVAIRPIKDGVIADFEVTERCFATSSGRPTRRAPSCVPHHHLRSLRMHRGRAARRPRVRAERGRPGGVSHRGTAGGRDRGGAPHHRTVRQHDRRHRRRDDRGGGHLPGGIVKSQSVRVAGDKMDEAILQYVKRKYNLLIGEPTAEHVKVAIGNAFPGFSETTEIKGLDMVSGVPKAIMLHSDEVREALSEPVRIIVDAVKSVFEDTPPELAGDIYERESCSPAGRAAAQPRRLAAEETGLPVVVAEDPLSCVVLGSGKALDELDLLRQVALH